jgi:hypothetical protein
MADDMELKLRIEAVLKGFEELGKAAQQVTNLGEAARGKASPGLEGMLNQMDPLAGKTAEAGKEFQRLMDKLDPLQALVNAFAKDLGTLNAAYKDGAMTQAEYARRVDDLDKYYQTLEPRARKAAEAIHGTGEAAQESAGRLGHLKETLLGLAASLGIILGVRETARLFKEMELEGAKNEHMFNSLALAEKMFTGATQADVEQGERWVTWLRQTYSVANDEIVPAYQRMIAVTKDVAEAQQLMEVAAGAAKEGMMSLTDASTVLTRYLETGVVMRGVDPLSNALREGKAAGEDFATILRTRLIPAFAEAGKTISDTQTELDKLAAGWKDAKAQMGEMLGGISAGIPILQGLIGFLEMVVVGISTVIQVAKMMGQTLGIALGFVASAITSGIPAAIATFREKRQEAVDEFEAWLRDMDARMKKLDVDIGVAAAQKPGTSTATGPGAGNAEYWRAVEEADKRELELADKSSAKRIEIFKREVAIARVTFGEGSNEYAAAMQKLIAETDRAAKAATESAKQYASNVKAALRDMGFNDKGEIKLPYRPGFGDRTEEDAYLKKLTERLFQEGEAAKKAAEADGKWVQSLIQANDPMAKLQADLERLNKALKEGAISQAQFTEAETALYADYNKKMDELRKKNDETSKLAAAAWKKAGEEIQHSLAEFLFDPFAKGLKGMLAGFIDMIRRMLSEALAANIMQALMGGGGGGFWGSLIGLFGGHMGGSDGVPAYGHTGGMAESLSGTGPATMLAMIGAPRLHAGALLGLQSDEVPAILQRGEEVLSRNDPRNALNGGGSGSVRVLNILDPNLVHDYLQSSAGEKVVVNHINRNAGTIKQILARA